MSASSGTFVIAEAASTHDGVLEKALALVAKAAECGADACKFQFWSDADRLAARRRVDDRYLKIYRRYQVPQWWLPILAGECKGHGIEFMCTTFMPEDIEVVAPHVDRFKVASFEAGDGVFLRAHNRFAQPVILSTGMMDMAQVHQAVKQLKQCEAVLHCVSAYPCNYPDLQVIRQMAAELPCVGFSDHSGQLMTGALAVMAGAAAVEVHFNLPSTTKDNPDNAPAVSSLKDYIVLLRQAEKFIGTGIKQRVPEETAMAQYRVS